MSGNDRVAAELRAEVARQRMSARRVAELMKEPPSTVARKLRGETPLSVSEVEKFADVLHVSVVDLMARAFTIPPPRDGGPQLPTPPKVTAPARAQPTGRPVPRRHRKRLLATVIPSLRAVA